MGELLNQELIESTAMEIQRLYKVGLEFGENFRQVLAFPANPARKGFSGRGQHVKHKLRCFSKSFLSVWLDVQLQHGKIHKIPVVSTRSAQLSKEVWRSNFRVTDF